VHPRVVICVPSGITQVERRAVQESAGTPARARLPHRRATAPPSARGCPSRSRGQHDRDIGAHHEVAVISLSGIVFSSSLRIAATT